MDHQVIISSRNDPNNAPTAVEIPSSSGSAQNASQIPLPINEISSTTIAENSVNHDRHADPRVTEMVPGSDAGSSDGMQNEVTDNDCKNDEDEDAEEECEDDSDYEYTYDDEDDSHFAGFLQQPPAVEPVLINNDVVAVGSESASENEDKTKAATSKWREPSRQAVNMSLRAERETTGGKRRLAQDLYKIMMGDTAEQGFKLEPANEDSMDRWKILLFGFDEDSNLAKDLKLIGMTGVELEMTFPDQYPFEPPFVRVTKPKFKRQTGFVMNGAICMELLTSDGWNPINDIESVIVSIRSLLVVGDGRLEAAETLRCQQTTKKRGAGDAKETEEHKRSKDEHDEDDAKPTEKISASQIGGYSAAEARQAYSHLSDYHKKKGWDHSGWWAKKG
eukprot:CAMPEP_0116032636 /NCGR_PEP_ID=MMETSP0321-20121206/18296_1 /TAXON_ID=163516 /ORGANISM="Leptocylindrus danicus var. danicus, Strain B650" /LENGTH=390 /DNA_ID=CAMNT_0003508127 /DNA_START=6 /DNA_END=1178 /DNA_ORIENTATION=+